MSFQDSAFIFFIALLLFGPKKLPELARQLGKLMGEFRRASNEFRMQLDDELRTAEQADKQKKIEALEAAAPVAAPTAIPDPADDLAPHPHAALSAPATPSSDLPEHTIAPPAPLPIATSGDLALHPPATGLPVARNGSVSQAFDSIPEAAPDRSLHAHPDADPSPTTSHHAPEETAQHG